MKYVVPMLASALALLGSPAQAGETWQFDYLTVTNKYEPSQISLVSQTATQTVISLDTLAQQSGMFAAYDNDPGRFRNWFDAAVEHRGFLASAYFDVTVKPGYKVTAARIDADVGGELRAGAPNGVVSNSLAIAGSINGPDVWAAAITGEVWNLNGDVVHTDDDFVAVMADEFEARSTFSMGLSTSQRTYAQAGRIRGDDYWWYLNEASYANIWAERITVTFEIAPVPEPHAYAMLGGGLALLAFAARRRRNA